MNAIELEFNFQNKTDEEMTLFLMQKQIDAMQESVNKVRKKLFSEIGEIKRLCADLKLENEKLKIMLKIEKNSWEYKKEDYLFIQNIA